MVPVQISCQSMLAIYQKYNKLFSPFCELSLALSLTLGYSTHMESKRADQQPRNEIMTITQAQAIIDAKYQAGLLTNEKKTWLEKMIRRTEAYGNKLSWKRQAEMRANLLAD